MGRWINCKNCGHYYHTDLNRCPECGKHTVSFGKIAGTVAVCAVCIGAVVGIILGITEKQPSAPDVASGFIDRDKLYSQLEDIKNNISEQVSSSEETSSTDTSSKQTSSKTDSSKVSTSSEKSSSVETQSDESADELWERLFGNDPDGAVDFKDGKVYINLPAYLVYAIAEDYDITLTTELKNFGFTSAKRNKDGSATYIIAPIDYMKYCEDIATECKNAISAFLDNADDAGLTLEKQQVLYYYEFNSKGEPNNEQDKAIAILLGYLGNELQYMSTNHRVGFEVKFNYQNKESVSYKFPEIFKQVYEESK